VSPVTPWVKRLIVANVIVFFVQATAPPNFQRTFIEPLVFVPIYVFERPWSLITYMFLHGGVMHILFNMLALYFFGPRVEERLGARRFLLLYFISGLSGAALSFWFAPSAAIIGASGALFGVMLAFAHYWPDVQIYIMGVLPLPARVAVLLMAAFSLWSGLNGSRMGVADFAHLGGFAGGWLYLQWVDRTRGSKKFRAKATPTVAKENLLQWKRVDPKSVHEVNRAEVNRILDKISAKGLGSLTPQERAFLSNFVPPDDRVPPPT
jgi:membrane associated rhomboid family serine protease